MRTTQGFFIRCGWLLCAALLVGCGFQLRQSLNLPFEALAVTPEGGAGVALELSRQLGSSWRSSKSQTAPAQATIEILQEQREKKVVGISSTGQVREYEIILRVLFRVRDASNQTLLAPTTLEQTRSISFNESAVLAKELEEGLLYREMQTDMVQQILRRVSALRPTPPQS
jgi:LPS-assembly lipoprotein